MQTIISNAQFAKLCAAPAALRFTTSAAAIVLSLGLGLSGAPVLAQDTSGNDTTENGDPDVTVEIAAIEGQEFNGSVLGQFLPVVVGGFGDLLFLNRSEIGDVFLSFDGNLNAINAPRAFGSQNLSLPTYTIDSQGQGYALTTTLGIATGFVGEDDPSEIVSVSDAFAPGQVSDTGNFANGARPIFLNNQTAILLSDVGLANDGVATGDTRTFVLFAEFLGEFDQPVEFAINDDTITSLNFAGPNTLLASSSNLLSSANSAQTSNLLRVDISDGIDNLATQVGPNGNPQISLSGGLLGGDLTFDGFTFNGNTFEDGTVFGGGASFDAREFSANATSTAFVLNNALVGRNGSNDPSLPGQLLALDDKVILAISQTIRFGTPTSIGEVNFMGFNDVVLAANGDIFFTSSTTDLDGAPLANEVGLWRIINPGQADQAIVPVLTAGDELFLPAEDIERLFIETPPPGETSVRIADFNTVQQSFIAPNQTDGRPRFLSVNSDGHVATVLRIETNFGSLDAIVAQDDDGVFNIVAYVGQQITVNGPDDTRVITSFRAQFGSNDLDGAGDLYNSDEQLGFVVTLDDLATQMVESTSAVLRVSLNGQAPRPMFTEFLWNGGCGDDEFSTTCTINGQDGTNWVNAEDTREVAEDPPGSNPGIQRAILGENNVRISVQDVTITSIDGDATLILQNGRTLTLAESSAQRDLVIENGTLVNNGDFTNNTLVLDAGTLQANDQFRSFLSIAIQGGDGDGDIRIEGNADVVLNPRDGERGTATIIGSVSDRPVLATNLQFNRSDVTITQGSFVDVEPTGTLTFNDDTVATLEEARILGSGRVVVQDGSRLVTTGSTVINPDLEFFDADRSVGDSNATLTIMGDGLSIGSVLFARSDGTLPDESTRSLITTQFSTTQLEVELDDTVSVFEDYVVLGGEGSLELSGTLSLGSRSIFENTATLNLTGLDFNNLGDETSDGKVAGVGLLRNRGVLSGAGELNSVLDSTGEGTVELDGDTFIVTNLARAAQNPFSIFSNAETGVDATLLTADIIDTIDVVIDDLTVSGRARLRTSGDGTVFFSGNIATTDAEGDVDKGLILATNTLLLGEANLSEKGFFILGDADISQQTISVLGARDGSDFTLAGEGTAAFTNVRVRGIIERTSEEFAIVTSTIIDDDLLSSQTALDARFGEAFYNPNTTIAGLDGDVSVPVSLDNVTLDFITLRNEGLIALNDVTFVDAVFDNDVWAELSGTLTDGTIVNRQTARLQVNSGATLETRIENDGFIVVAANAGAIAIDTLEQSLVQTGASPIEFNDDGSSIGRQQFTVPATQSAALFVNSGATLTLNDTSLLAVTEDAAILQGLIGAEGTIIVKADDSELSLSRIGAQTNVVIAQGGRINNLDQNASDLNSIAGTFSAAGEYKGFGLRLTDSARVLFRGGLDTESVTIDRDALLFTPQLLRADDVDVFGQLRASRIAGDRLRVRGDAVVLSESITSNNIEVFGTLSSEFESALSVVTDSLVVNGDGALSAGFVEINGRFELLSNASASIVNLRVSDDAFLGENANLQVGIFETFTPAPNPAPADPTGIRPSTAAIASISRAIPQIAEATTDEDRVTVTVNGRVDVSQEANLDADLVVGDTGVVTVFGDASLTAAEINGVLAVGGSLTAETLDAQGQVQFSSGTFGEVTVGASGLVMGGEFSVSSDFANRGTFQLGDIEGGPGEFTTEGMFLQGGIFSGTGTINGSLLQAAQEGGRSGNELLFNPGFSPGILDITGDATFDDGVVLMEIGGLTPGTEHDQINVTGMLTFGSSATLVVDLLETASGEIFLPETGDEIVLFTASDISPDDVDQINFSVIDILPRGFTIVPDITTTADGEILRVLRGFNGSLLSDLSGLDPAQLAVAGAIDFLSSAQSGVPSIELFQLAVDLQFADTMAEQTTGLTELSATTLSGLQATALTAGRYNIEFIKDRLSASAITNSARQPARLGTAGTPTHAAVGGVASANRDFGTREFARTATNQINRSGAVSYGSEDGPTLRFLGAASVNFGDQGSRGGTIGFEQDGWSASLGGEFENADGRFVIGAAATLGENDADLDGGLGDASSESAGFGLYAAYNAGAVRVAAAYSGADLDLEANRQVKGRTASSSSDGSLKSLHAQIFAPVIDTNRIAIGPKVAFEHHDLEIDEFTETGAGDLSLLVSSLKRKASAMNLSVVADFGFDLGRWEGALEIEPGYQVALVGDNFIALPASFAIAPGTQFSNPLLPLMNDGFALDVGLSLASEKGLDFRVTYDGLFGQNGQEQHAISAQAVVAF